MTHVYDTSPVHNAQWVKHVVGPSYAHLLANQHVKHWAIGYDFAY